jgi:cyclophilin family peptidyl-prolyl cis-trans isomerase
MTVSDWVRGAGAAVTALVLPGTVLATEVAICTDMGAVTVELYDEQAPAHTANFLEYVDQGFYTNTAFHRVIDGFMVQGGGYDRQLRQKAAGESIANESRNGLSNRRGTLAAARTSDPDSAASQFYINVVDNARLDASGDDLGYTVYGEIVEGMDVVDRIASLPTRGSGPFASDVPEPLVAVRSVARLNRSAMEALPEIAPENALRDAVVAAAAESDPAATLASVGHLRAACVTMDPELLLIEAEAAAAASRGPRAKSALDEYFALATDAEPGYERALALYGEVAPGEQPSIVAPVADCDLPDEPEIPDGTAATLDAMVEGQASVRDFMAASEMYLECLNDIIDEEDLSDEQHANNVREHNRVVSVMEQLAEEFNAQVRAFRAREQ